MIDKRHPKDYIGGKVLTRFLESKVGQPWNDVFSEICSFADYRSKSGRELRRRLNWNVYIHVKMVNGEPYVSGCYSSYPIHGLYVNPDTGILCLKNNVPYIPKPKKLEKILWKGNTWFELETFERPAKCGCVHFKHPLIEKRNRWSSYPEQPAICIHGNESKKEDIWYVIEYDFHSLDEIYKTYVAYNEYDLLRYNLKKVGDIKHIYYRDVPEVDRRFVVLKKQANHKELKALRKLILTK
jgi:hypothetical protein